MSNNSTLATFFISNVLTVSGRNHLAASLQKLRENVFNTATKEIYKKDLVGFPEEYVHPLIAASSAAPNQTAARVLDTIIVELTNLPVAELTLPYRPTSKQTKEILQFLRAKLQPELILKLHYEPQLTAGFVLEYSGLRVDRSLTTVLQEKYV